MLVLGRIGGSSAPSMNLWIIKIAITVRFLASIRADRMMAIWAITVHSDVLDTDEIMMIIGTVRKKNSRKV